ncbi:MAG: CRISPR system precrRNA processing endoribonuclease RAMP protein Cas6 [Desulfomonilaceae bacterium]
MLLGIYDFHSTFTGSAILPPYKGSTIRGAFGVALKKSLCALKLQECPTCPLRLECLYARVFENLPENDLSGGKGIPHPFVVEPPLDEKTDYSAGDSFDFRLLLFGQANENLNYFIYASQQMGRLGLGKLINGKRASFELKTVHSGANRLFDCSDGTIIPADPQNLDLDAFRPPSPGSGSVKIIFQTPLRLKFQNRFNDALPFHVLIRAALRRISFLNIYFGQGEPDLDYRGLVNRSNDMKTVDSDLRWLDWERYSNRQEKRMQMGGLVGMATYEGRLTEFIPLLQYCEQVHLGKATTFGLGKIIVI